MLHEYKIAPDGLSGHSMTVETNHALAIHVPDLKTEAAADIRHPKRRALGRLELRNGTHGLRKAVKGNLRIEMMDMVVANICGEPGHNRVNSQKAGRFQCRLLVSPTTAIRQRNIRKIVLNVEKVGSDGVGDEMRNRLNQDQRFPSSKQE